MLCSLQGIILPEQVEEQGPIRYRPARLFILGQFPEFLIFCLKLDICCVINQACLLEIIMNCTDIHKTAATSHTTQP